MARPGVSSSPNGRVYFWVQKKGMGMVLDNRGLQYDENNQPYIILSHTKIPVINLKKDPDDRTYCELLFNPREGR